MWKEYYSTLICPVCGFGYFPTGDYFKDKMYVNGRKIFRFCPDCGKEIGVEQQILEQK